MFICWLGVTRGTDILPGAGTETNRKSNGSAILVFSLFVGWVVKQGDLTFPLAHITHTHAHTQCEQKKKLVRYQYYKMARERDIQIN